MSWYVAVLKKYGVFSGRARRKEYWMFYLFNLIFSVGIFILELILGIGDWGVLSGLYSLALFIPGLAVTVRRLHDTDHSGWWLFFGLIPLIGGIILLVILASDSQWNTNRYGPSPKYGFGSQSEVREVAY